MGRYYLTSDVAGISGDPFFQSLDLFFKNELRSAGRFEPFTDGTKVPYPLDCYFDSDKLVFEIPIPDAIKEDIEVTRTSDNLRIKYTRTNKPEDGRTYIKRGLVKRDFDLSWRITSKFDSSNITSKFEGGILTIHVPFATESKPEAITIQ